MILYSLRRKDTGEKFNGWRWDESPYWNDKGTFWKDIDAVARHLRWLCTDEKWEDKLSEHHRKYGASRKTMLWNVIRPKNVDLEKAKLYEVLVHDVTINGTKQLPAEELLNGNS